MERKGVGFNHPFSLFRLSWIYPPARPTAMLTSESPSSHEQQSFFQHFSMDDASMHQHLNSLDADGLNPFEAYSTFPSDPSPFILHPSSFLLEDNNSSSNKNVQPSYPLPSGSPPLSASLSLEHPFSASSSSSSHSINSGPPSSIGSPNPENWADMDPGSGYPVYGTAGLDGFVGKSIPLTHTLDSLAC